MTKPLPGLPPIRRSPSGGGALLAAIMLSLAMLLMTHGLLLLATAELRASVARSAQLRSIVELRSAVVAATRDSLSSAVRDLAVDSTVSIGDVGPVERTLRRVGHEVWVVEARHSSRRAGALSLPIVLLDAHGRPDGLPTGPTGITTGPFALGPLSHRQLSPRLSTVPSGVVSPRPRADGAACLTTAPLNWGDPAGGTAPCADRWVAIAAPGGLHVVDGVGQGALFVDGDLVLERARFTGVVVVTGTARLLDGSRIVGWLHADEGVSIEDSSGVVPSMDRAGQALGLPPFRYPFVLRPVRWSRTFDS